MAHLTGSIGYPQQTSEVTSYSSATPAKIALGTRARDAAGNEFVYVNDDVGDVNDDVIVSVIVSVIVIVILVVIGTLLLLSVELELIRPRHLPPSSFPPLLRFRVRSYGPASSFPHLVHLLDGRVGDP